MRLDSRRQRVHVLRGRTPDAHAHAFLTIAPLRPIVLRKTELARAGLQHHAAKHAAIVRPTLTYDEAEDIGVKAHAPFDVVDSEARLERSQPERLGTPLAALHGARCGALLRGCLLR